LKNNHIAATLNVVDRKVLEYSFTKKQEGEGNYQTFTRYTFEKTVEEFLNEIQ
jgi:hypothetical protein